MAKPTEKSSLLPSGATVTAAGSFVSGGVKKRTQRKSLVAQSQDADKDVKPMTNRQKSRSFSIAPSGEVVHLTPAEMGRKELYENIPMLATMGMQKKERSMSLAFANFAAERDVVEADNIALSRTGKGLTDKEKTKVKFRASTMIVDQLDAESSTVTTPLIFAVIGAAIPQFAYGYNIGNMSCVEKFVFPGHSTSDWAMAVSAFALAGPFGAMMGGKLADSRGRRGGLLVVSWAMLIGGLVQALAPNMLFVSAARFVIGLASGASTVIVPVFLGELAPPTLRGVLGTLTQFALVIGIFASSLVSFPLANEKGWRWIFLGTSVLAGCELLIANWLLESPRWLLTKNPNSGKARFIIKVLRGYKFDHEMEADVDMYIGSQKAQSSSGEGEKKEPKNATAEMFADKNVRILVISAIVLNMAQQLSGINAVMYYSGMFFDGIIENPMIGALLVTAVNIIATYVALLLMDTCGRRTLVMWSAGGMGLSCCLVVAALLGYMSKTMALFAVMSAVFFFAVGMGPIPSLIIPEMFDGKYVMTAMSISSQVNWTFAFFVGLGFPYMIDYLGPYSFGPFAVALLLTFLFALFVLPETVGTTPEELQQMLAVKNAGMTYHNMAMEEVEGTTDELEAAMKELTAEFEAA